MENKLVKAQSNSDFWIGLNDVGSEGQWRWVGGEDPVFIKWSGVQPDNAGGGEDCAHMYSRSGFWNDGECDKKLASVCEIGARDC